MGFRPFFLLGTAVGAISLLTWVLAYLGYSDRIEVDSLWHAHEMVFGFVLAIIVGFLLTASQNWSGKRGVQGRKLVVLITLWLLARILAYIPGISGYLVAFIDLAFLPFVIFLLWPYLITVPQKRNRGFPILLAMLWLCNLMFYMSVNGVEEYRRKSLLIAIQLIVVIVVIISGRVIPFFSKNAIQNYRSRNCKTLNVLSLLTTILFFFIYSYSEYGNLVFGCGLMAAVIHFTRFCIWFDKRILFKPILWILYIGYLWLAVAYLMSGLAATGKVLPSMATHAFTVGAISVMIFGMMSRVTLGHTGRSIVASPFTILAYTLVICAGILRVGVPIINALYYNQSVFLAAICWFAAAVCFLLEYGSVLILPRVDKKTG